MIRYTLHVPAQYNDGESVDQEFLRGIEYLIENAAGGWTLTAGMGGWVGEDTRYREPVLLYHVDTDEVEKVGASMHKIADTVASALDQEAVYLTAQEITTTLIAPKVRA